jgi:hypothetical protein
MLTQAKLTLVSSDVVMILKKERRPKLESTTLAKPYDATHVFELDRKSLNSL